MIENHSFNTLGEHGVARVRVSNDSRDSPARSVVEQAKGLRGVPVSEIQLPGVGVNTSEYLVGLDRFGLSSEAWTSAVVACTSRSCPKD